MSNIICIKNAIIYLVIMMLPDTSAIIKDNKINIVTGSSPSIFPGIENLTAREIIIENTILFEKKYNHA